MYRGLISIVLVAKAWLISRGGLGFCTMVSFLLFELNVEVSLVFLSVLVVSRAWVC